MNASADSELDGVQLFDEAKSASITTLANHLCVCGATLYFVINALRAFASIDKIALSISLSPNSLTTMCNVALCCASICVLYSSILYALSFTLTDRPKYKHTHTQYDDDDDAEHDMIAAETETNTSLLLHQPLTRRRSSVAPLPSSASCCQRVRHALSLSYIAELLNVCGSFAYTVSAFMPIIASMLQRGDDRDTWTTLLDFDRVSMLASFAPHVRVHW